MSAIPPQEAFFSRARLQDTLSYGYIEMLGTLSKYPEGVEYVFITVAFLYYKLTQRCCLHRLMEKFKVFTCLYRLSELKNREDLVRAVLENLDYSG